MNLLVCQFEKNAVLDADRFIMPVSGSAVGPRFLGGIIGNILSIM